MKRALSDYDFHKTVIEDRQAALVICYTPDSGLCKLVIDLVEEIGDKFAGSLRVYIMHVLDSKDTCLTYRVSSLPTILYFREGVLVNRMAGINYGPALRKQIENFIGGDFMAANPLFIEVTDEKFAALTQDYAGLVILNFWVAGIETCWAMQNDLAMLAERYAPKLKVGVVNFKESKDLATRYRIAEIPTMIFLCQQREEERLVGMKNLRTIENAIRSIGYRCGVL